MIFHGKDRLNQIWHQENHTSWATFNGKKSPHDADGICASCHEEPGCHICGPGLKESVSWKGLKKFPALRAIWEPPVL